MAAEKSYLIKVPVFTTSSFGCTEDEIFGYTYQTMIDDIKSIIDGKFKPIHSNNRNKTKTSVISNVEYSEKAISDRPCLLIRIAAFSTNINVAPPNGAAYFRVSAKGSGANLIVTLDEEIE